MAVLCKVSSLLCLTLSHPCSEGSPHCESSFSIPICCPLSRLHLHASIPSMKWHYPSMLFSVFLFSNSQARSLQYCLFPEIWTCLAWCDRNISSSCFLHLPVNSHWCASACSKTHEFVFIAWRRINQMFVCGVECLFRYYLCLQLRMDLCNGQLHCSAEQLISLSALIVQCMCFLCAQCLVAGLVVSVSDFQ